MVCGKVERSSGMDTGFTLFDTPIGPCGMAWGDAGIVDQYVILGALVGAILSL